MESASLILLRQATFRERLHSSARLGGSGCHDFSNETMNSDTTRNGGINDMDAECGDRQAPDCLKPTDMVFGAGHQACRRELVARVRLHARRRPERPKKTVRAFHLSLSQSPSVSWLRALCFLRRTTRKVVSSGTLRCFAHSLPSNQIDRRPGPVKTCPSMATRR